MVTHVRCVTRHGYTCALCYKTWLHTCTVLQDMVTRVRCDTRHGYTCALCYKTWLHVCAVIQDMVTRVHCVTRHGYTCALCYKTWLHMCTVLQDIVTHVHCVTRHGYTRALCYKTWLHVCPVLQDMVTRVPCVTRHGYTCALCYKTWLHMCTVASRCIGSQEELGKSWLHMWHSGKWDMQHVCVVSYTLFHVQKMSISMHCHIVKEMKLAYYGHILRKKWDCLEKELIQGTTPGSRTRGRPKMTWIDNIKSWTGLSLTELTRKVEDRYQW